MKTLTTADRLRLYNGLLATKCSFRSKRCHVPVVEHHMGFIGSHSSFDRSCLASLVTQFTMERVPLKFLEDRV